MKGEGVVIVLGGAGAVGGMLTRLFEQAGFRTFCIDEQAPPKQMGCWQLNLESTSSLDRSIFRHAAAVIFALPENVAVQALPQVLKVLNRDVLLVPTCSVQGPFHVALKATAPAQPWMGLNPMFSPRLDVSGRLAVICLDDIHAPLHWLEKLLSDAGVTVSRMTVEQHDRTMALCQALPHSAVIAFGMALVNSGADLEVLAKVAPPPMRTMMALLSRILTNPMEVYWDIQHENRFAAEQRHRLITALSHLNAEIQDNNKTGFANQLSDVAQTLGPQCLTLAEDCQQLFVQLNECEMDRHRTTRR